MFASKPNFFSLGEPRLAVICLAAKMRVSKATDVAKDLLEDHQIDTFSTFVSHFLAPRNSVWRQIPDFERRRLIEARYPQSIKVDQQADASTVARLVNEWYKDLVRHMPEVLFMAPRQPIVAVAQNMDSKKPSGSNCTSTLKSSNQQKTTSKLTEVKKPILSKKRTRDEDMEKPASKKIKLVALSSMKPTTTSSTSFAAKYTGLEKLPITKKRALDEYEQTEATASEKTQLAAPRNTRLTTVSSVPATAKDTSTEKPKQQYRYSENEIARFGRRPQGTAWKSKISPIYC